MIIYNSLSEAVGDLRARGYALDFNIIFDKIRCLDNGLCLNPSEFEITEFHRFEDNTDPADEAIVYAVESKDGKIRGLITGGYGTYSEDLSEEMMSKLRMNIK